MRFSFPIAAALLAGLLAGVISPVPPVAAAPAAEESTGPLFHDDADRTAWSYLGRWDSAKDVAWTMGQHDNSETWSNETGARAQLQFFGTGATIYGPKGPNGGAYRVTLDCSTTVEGTSFAPVKVNGQGLATFDDLPRGWHTVVVEVVGHSPQGSTNDFVMIDVAAVRDEPRWSESAPELFHGQSSDLLQDIVTGPVELRRPGCGAASSLVDALKARVTNGVFIVPSEDRTKMIRGRVNAHSAESGTPRECAGTMCPALNTPGGPVVMFGDAVEAATVPVYGTSQLDLTLPDRPRTLQLEVVADDTIGVPFDFAVGQRDGSRFLPMLVKTESGVQRHDGTPVRLEPGHPVSVLVDLRDVHGAGGFDEVSLWSHAAGTAQLDILSGRTTDVALDRMATQLFGPGAIPADPHRLAAPASAFQYGPVVLSRVIADYAQPAWVGDQSSPPESLGTAAPLLFGEVSPGVPFTVNGDRLPADTIGVRLPAAPDGAASSSVVLRFDTASRCRTLSALVGLDDSSPDLAGSSVAIAVYGDGEALRAHHNGIWRDGVPGHGAPLQNGADREALVGELLAAKLSAIAAVDSLAGGQRAALEAVARAEAEGYGSSTWSNSAALMTYPVGNPVVLGVGSNVASGAPSWFTSHSYNQQGVTAIDQRAPFPLSVDLITAQSREALRSAATSQGGTVTHFSAPLVRDVRLVVSGTPGAVVALGSAGMDCVSVEPASGGSTPPAAMPRWSQLEVPPLFLPAPTNASGRALERLAANPLWWDTVCPQGPSLDGMTFEAVREKHTTYRWSQLTHTGQLVWKTATVVERATASNPACAFPSDQLTTRYSEFERIQDPHVAAGATVAEKAVIDPVREQYDMIGASWQHRVVEWMKKLIAETKDDGAAWAIWLVMAPFDPVGALIFNPFTLHALPWQAQVALGAAYGAAATMAESALVRVLPSATATAVSSGIRTDELLLTTASRAKADVAAGSAALVDLGKGGEVLVPLKSSTTADVTVPKSAVAFVDADRATATMPLGTSARVPWFEDAGVVSSEEIARLCPRDVEMECSGSGRGSTKIKVQGSKQWRSGALDIPRDRPAAVTDANVPTEDYATGPGYANRYAGASLIKTISPYSDQHPIAEVAAAVREVRISQEPEFWVAYLQMPGLGPATRVEGQLSADNLPLYSYSVESPSTIFPNGFALDPQAHLMPNHTEWMNIANVFRPAGPESMMTVASRDPDLLSALPAGTTLPHWRYKITRPAAGGGVDFLATYDQLPAHNANAELLQIFEIFSPVGFPGGIKSSSIERADYLEFNPTTGRFEVLASVPNPHFDVSRYPGGVLPPLSKAERYGAPQWNTAHTADTLRFDYGVNQLGENYSVSAPPPELVASRMGFSGSKLVWSKELGDWVLLPKWFSISDEHLRQSGFVMGYWEDVYGLVKTWVPEMPQMPNGFKAAPHQTRSTTELPSPERLQLLGSAGVITETTTPYAPTGPDGGVYDIVADGDLDSPTRWTVVQAGLGTIRLINETTGRALQVTGQSPPGREAEYIVVASPVEWDTDWQRWTIERQEDGTMVVRSAKFPELVLQGGAPDGCAEPCIATAAPAGGSGQLWLWR